MVFCFWRVPATNIFSCSKSQRRPFLISEAEEEIVIQLARNRRQKGKVVNIEWTKKVINKVTLGRVPSASDSYITKFWRKHKWTNRRAYQRTTKECRPSLIEEINQCIKKVEDYIKEHKIPASNVFIMDETGLWTGTINLRTYVDPKTCDSSIIRNCTSQRDTGVVAISSSGIVFPYFIKHVP